MSTLILFQWAVGLSYYFVQRALQDPYTEVTMHCRISRQQETRRINREGQSASRNPPFAMPSPMCSTLCPQAQPVLLGILFRSMPVFRDAPTHAQSIEVV